MQQSWHYRTNWTATTAFSSWRRSHWTAKMSGTCTCAKTSQWVRSRMDGSVSPQKNLARNLMQSSLPMSQCAEMQIRFIFLLCVQSRTLRPLRTTPPVSIDNVVISIRSDPLFLSARWNILTSFISLFWFFGPVVFLFGSLSQLSQGFLLVIFSRKNG